jgi:hypothetical protein
MILEHCGVNSKHFLKVKALSISSSLGIALRKAKRENHPKLAEITDVKRTSLPVLTMEYDYI